MAADQLTSFGEAFALRVNEILRHVDELGGFARASSRPFSGQLRIGVIPTIAPYLLPRIITDIARHYPQVELCPREAVTRKLMEDLHDSRLDAAVLALPVADDVLQELALFDEEFVLVRPLADAKKPVPSYEMLRSMKILLLEEGHCFRDQALSFCNISPSLKRDMIEGNSLSTLVQMVGVGIGVTLIPEMAVQFETHIASVAISRLQKPRPTRTIGMVWRKSNPLSKQLAQIAAIIKRNK